MNRIQKTLPATNIHGPFHAADVYPGENITAVLKFNENDRKVSLRLRVWRLSPLGVELFVTPEHESSLDVIKVESEVCLVVHMGKQECEFFGIVVCAITRVEKRLILGIRWCLKDTEKDGRDFVASDDRRGAQRWLCGDAFLPSGVAPNPTRFNDFIHFRVQDISKNGMRLSTSLRNRYLIPGMVLYSHVSFPLFGIVDIKMRIVDAFATGAEYKQQLSLGVRLEWAHPDVLHIIGNYIMQFSPDVDIKDVKAEHLFTKKLSDKLSYEYVKSKRMYDEVLKLRHISYQAIGKVSSGTSVEAMGDIYDSRARIITGRFRGEIVCSVRVMFHEAGDSLELEQFTSLPKDFPRKDEFVEVTRFCIHPDFQGGDLNFGMMKQLFLVMEQTRRRWIVSFASKDMMDKFYLKFGAEPFGLPFKHSKLNNSEQIPFLFDIQKVIKGISVGPIVWNLLIEDIYEYLKENDYLVSDLRTKVRINIYRLFRPISAYILKRMMQVKRIKTTL